MNQLHSPEHELSLLASMMLDETHRDIAVDTLKYTDFYITNHQSVFRAIAFLHRRRQAVDLPGVVQCLKEHGATVPAAFVASILDQPMCINPEETTRKILQLSRTRDLVRVCQGIPGEIENCGGDYGAVLDRAQERILGIDFGGTECFMAADTLMDELVDACEGSQNGQRNKTLRTGFVAIDMLLGGGLRGPVFVILAARPSVGKTAMACSIIRQQCLRGHRVGFFSVEMSRVEISKRLVAQESGINLVRIANPNMPMDKDAWRKITEAAGRVSKWGLVVDDTAPITIQEIKRRSRKMVKAGVGAIYIDQLSKIGGGLGSEYEKRSQIVNELAILKKEINIPVVLLAQINRQADGSRPRLGDLKSTGSLEEDADIVLLGHRDIDDKEATVAEWNLAKNRQGPTRRVEVRWYPKVTMFGDKE
jgi:replicative DNA helicase